MDDFVVMSTCGQRSDIVQDKRMVLTAKLSAIAKSGVNSCMFLLLNHY